MSDPVGTICDACARSTSGRCAVHGVGFVVPAAGLPIAAPNGGVQGPFSGPDAFALGVKVARLEREGQAHAELLLVQSGKLTAAEEEVARLQEVLAAAACTYVDCICPGCPRKVPAAWASGMCEPCAGEDCEHTDGAREVEAKARELAEQCRRLEDESNEARRVAIGAERERDDLRADVESLRDQVAQLETAMDAYGTIAVELDKVQAERDRLAAVLAETEGDPDWMRTAKKVLRARAAVTEPTETERKAKAFDEVRCLLAEFENVDEGRAALACIGEFIGEWEYHAVRREARAQPDSAAAVVNRDQREAGARHNLTGHAPQGMAQAQPAGAAAAPTGTATYPLAVATSVCPNHPEHLCVAMAANMPGRPSGLCVYGCAIDNGHPPPAGLEMDPPASGPTSSTKQNVYPWLAELPGLRTYEIDVAPPPALKPAHALQVIAGGRELMRVMNGVTPDDLRAQGFPDVAAALERRR